MKKQGPAPWGRNTVGKEVEAAGWDMVEPPRLKGGNIAASRLFQAGARARGEAQDKGALRMMA
jgi:hypothetical protein